MSSVDLLNFYRSFTVNKVNGGDRKIFIYGPRREKTCLRVSDKASFKSVSSATETS